MDDMTAESEDNNEPIAIDIPNNDVSLKRKWMTLKVDFGNSRTLTSIEDYCNPSIIATQLNRKLNSVLFWRRITLASEFSKNLLSFWKSIRKLITSNIIIAKFIPWFSQASRIS